MEIEKCVKDYFGELELISANQAVMFTQSKSNELGFYLLELVDFDGTMRIEMRVPKIINDVSLEIVCTQDIFSAYSTFNQATLVEKLDWGYNLYLTAFYARS